MPGKMQALRGLEAQVSVSEAFPPAGEIGSACFVVIACPSSELHLFVDWHIDIMMLYNVSSSVVFTIISNHQPLDNAMSILAIIPLRLVDEYLSWLPMEGIWTDQLVREYDTARCHHDSGTDLPVKTGPWTLGPVLY
jgi:hypothetical protein